MRCLSCNSNLSDFESTRKSKITGDYIDLCSDCYSTIADTLLEIEENLDPEEDLEDESLEFHGWMEAL